MNFIHSIKVITPTGKDNIELHLPIPNIEKNLNSITVIAGKNRSGKSHILNHINSSLVKLTSEYRNNNNILKKIQESNIQINMTDDINIPPTYEIVKDISPIMKMGNKISFQILEKMKYNFLGEYRRALFGLISDIFESSSLLNDGSFDKNKYLSDEDYRKEQIVLLEKESDVIYPCNNSIEIIDSLEKAFNARIYLGVPRHKSPESRVENDRSLVLYMYFGENSCYSYESWSSGQRALFSYLLIVYYINPEILLIDELENHMHPEYMSLLMETINRKIKQTIITSHHPHLIFSKYIDEVFYVETNSPLIAKDLTKTKKIPLNSGNRNLTSKDMSPIDRKINKLVDEFDKVTSIYHLFDEVDNNLIRLANNLSTKLNLQVLKNLEKAFNYPPIGENKSSMPDMQSLKIIDFLKQKIRDNSNEALHILDYGAGIGRTYAEINKSILPEPFGKHQWSLWEPYQEYRQKIKEKYKSEKSINIIEYPDNILKKSYDIAIVANVLHECNPSDFVTIVSHIHHALKENGQLIVVELYPLVDPEKLAVAYNIVEMAKIFGKGTGWNIDSSEEIPMKNAKISAYWMLIGKNEDYNSNEFFNNLIQVWKEIQEKHTLRYSQRKGVGNQFQINALIHEMMALSSMLSYEQGQWKNFLNEEGYKKFKLNM